MDSKEFVAQNSQVVDYIINYLNTVKERKILSDVSPGYLSKIIPEEMPKEGENFTEIFKDFDEKIMKGVVHWAHPNFHGYLPSSHAYPSILADMFSDACGSLGFSWIAGPSIVELEIAMTDWLAVSLGLPSAFYNKASDGNGGGIMASSASECALLTILGARYRAVNYLKNQSSKVQDNCEYLKKLVAYCSEEAHSCVEKAANAAMITLRVLATNEFDQFSPKALHTAMEEDLNQGLFPCFVVVTLGTSSSGAFDNLEEITQVVKSLSAGCWIHVNAAYGGNNFICPELRGPLAGIHLADSICVNPYKGLLINIDSTCLWVRDRVSYCSALKVDPIYLKNYPSDRYLDHKNWSLWLSRRFRSLKIWFTFRLYGVVGLQKHVRQMIKMARKFADFVKKEDRFELCNVVNTPLVCFRMIGSNGINQELLANINSSNKILMTPAMIKSKYVLRFVVSHEGTNEETIKTAWDQVVFAADKIYSEVLWDEDSEKRMRRLSYTRRVSFMDYRLAQRRNSLKDVNLPVLVPSLEED